MIEKTLSDLFLAQLKDIYYAEKKIFRTLPKMVKAARVPELKQAFTTHREETQGHIERLEQVFEMIGKRPQSKPCEAINGIVAEGEETIEDFGESAAIDTGLVAAGQAVEHYEMARYGALIAWASQLNMPKAAALLNENLLVQLPEGFETGDTASNGKEDMAEYVPTGDPSGDEAAATGSWLAQQWSGLQRLWRTVASQRGSTA